MKQKVTEFTAKIVENYGVEVVGGIAITVGIATGAVVYLLYVRYFGGNAENNRMVDLSEGNLPELSEIPEDVQSRSIRQLKNNGLDYSNPLNIRKQSYLVMKYRDKAEEDIRISAINEDADKAKADKSMIAPDNIKERKDYLIRDGDYVKELTVTDYPEQIPEGWLTPILTMNSNVRLNMGVLPRSTEDTRDKLQGNLTKYRAKIARKREKNRSDVHEEERKIEMIVLYAKDFVRNFSVLTKQ
ncbi:MAG: hypothetical protein ABEK59_04830, partial [Halobacteria archaeon]